MKICIDPGHGGDAGNGDPGAVYNNLQEDDFNLIVASLVTVNLMSKGFEVVQTRGADSFISLQRRCEISNETGCDVFVSIHANAAINKDASGVEVLCLSDAGEKLSNSILNKILHALPFKNRGAKRRDNLYVLKNSKAVAALVECGFLSNASEANILKSESVQIKMAAAIADGIAFFCNNAGAK